MWETSICGLPFAPWLGIEPTTSVVRYETWPRIEPTTFWCMGQCTSQLSHSARATSFLFMYGRHGGSLGCISTEADGGKMVLAINLLRDAWILVNLKLLCISWVVGKVKRGITVIRGQVGNVMGFCGGHHSHMTSETKSIELKPLPMRKHVGKQLLPLGVGITVLFRFPKMCDTVFQRREMHIHTTVCVTFRWLLHLLCASGKGARYEVIGQPSSLSQACLPSRLATSYKNWPGLSSSIPPSVSAGPHIPCCSWTPLPPTPHPGLASMLYFHRV